MLDASDASDASESEYQSRGYLVLVLLLLTPRCAFCHLITRQGFAAVIDINVRNQATIM